MVVFLLIVIAQPGLAAPLAGPVPTMSISLDPPQAEAEVTQSQGDTVEFKGTVEINQPVWMTSELILKGVVGTGWPVEVDPNGTEVTGPMTIHFTTTVEIPAATSSYLTGNVIISGSLKAPALSAVVTTGSAIVTIKQYYKLRIEASDPLIELERGQSGKIEVNIYNDGNGQDTFDLSLIDMPDGIRASLGQNQAIIHQDEYETIILDVTVEEDAPDVQHIVMVKVISVGSAGEYDKTYPVYVYVRTFSDNFGAPGLSVSFVILMMVAVSLVYKKLAR
jgi:uncharacterized membrane protein